MTVICGVCGYECDDHETMTHEERLEHINQHLNDEHDGGYQ